jgi:hypothetical protein
MFMRTLLFLLLSFTIGLPAFCQTATAIVSMSGIGEIKVGMKKAELEKLTGKPVKLDKLLRKTDSDRDTLAITLHDLDYEVVMEKNYIDDKRSEFVVWEVRSTAAPLKTKSGIGIGDDKLKIISTYETYMIQIMPEWENNYTVKSKTRSTVWLFGDNGTVIIFYLTNNKVTGFSVAYNEGC